MVKPRVWTLFLAVVLMVSLTRCTTKTTAMTPNQIDEWCVFRTKAAELWKADDAFNTEWNERISQDPPLSSDEWQTLVNQYSVVQALACGLPITPLEAKPISAKLCSGADSWMRYFRGKDGPQNKYLRIQGGQDQIDGYRLLDETDLQIGNPTCE